MKYRKILSALLAVTLAAGAFTGCSSKSSSSDEDTSSKASDSTDDSDDDDALNIAYRNDMDSEGYTSIDQLSNSFNNIGDSYRAFNDRSTGSGETEWSVLDPEDEKELTIMVYVVGSNLESGGGCASTDIIEMLESGFTNEDVNLVVYCGGAYSWYIDIPKNKNSYLVYDHEANDFNVFADNQKNMASADTFADFLTEVPDKFPAEHYGLICWDHGGGPTMGFGLDEVYSLLSNDCLTLEEMKEGLDASPFAGQKLDFIGFDACLMASIEVADLWKDYADYMIASVNSEPFTGWNYHFLNILDETTDPVAIGRNAVDYYDDFLTANKKEMESLMGGKLEYSLALFDLAYTEDVVTDFDALLGTAADDYSSGKLYPISMMAKTNQYDGYDLWDLANYSKRMKKYSSAESKALTKSLKNFTVYGATNIRKCSCLSFYFPYGGNSDSLAIYEHYGSDYIQSMPLSPNYTRLVDMYKPSGAGKSSAFKGLKIASGSGSDGVDSDTGNLIINGSEGSYQLSEEQMSDFGSAYYTVFRQFDEGDFGTSVEGYNFSSPSDDTRDFEVLVEQIPVTPDDDGNITIDLDPRVVVADTDTEMEYTNVCQVKVISSTEDETVYRTVNGVLETGQYQDNLVRDNERVYADITISSDPAEDEAVIRNIEINEDDGFHVGGKSVIDTDEWHEYLNYVQYVKIPNGKDVPYTECGTLSLIWRTTPFDDSFGFKTAKVSDLPEYDFGIQLVICDRSGAEHATPITMIPKDSDFEEVTVPTEKGEFTYRIYSDHAKLIKYKGSDTKLDVPGEVNGVTVTEMGSRVFDVSTSEKLTELNFPDSIEVMGKVFRNSIFGMEDLKKVHLPASLKILPTAAFEYCKSLTDIELPDGLEYIGERAFYSSGIKKIDIPASVRFIGPLVFGDCPSLKTVKVDKDNEVYTAKDNILYSKDMTVLIACCGPAPKNFKVPSGVTEIADYAFYGSSSLEEELIYPDDYNILDYFGDWLETETDEWDRLQKLEEYGVEVNYNYSGLEKLTLPDGLVRIGDYAFTDCVKLSSIDLPDSLEYIGTAAFGMGSGTDSHYYKAENYESIPEIHIGPNVERIRVGAFCGYQVEKFTVDEDNPYFEASSGKLTQRNSSDEVQWMEQHQFFLE